jgi:hypothetical protein
MLLMNELHLVAPRVTSGDSASDQRTAVDIPLPSSYRPPIVKLNELLVNVANGLVLAD